MLFKARVSGEGILDNAEGGAILTKRMQPERHSKMPGVEFAIEFGVSVGECLGK